MNTQEKVQTMKEEEIKKTLQGIYDFEEKQFILPKKMAEVKQQIRVMSMIPQKDRTNDIFEDEHYFRYLDALRHTERAGGMIVGMAKYLEDDAIARKNMGKIFGTKTFIPYLDQAKILQNIDPDKVKGLFACELLMQIVGDETHQDISTEDAIEYAQMIRKGLVVE